MKLSILLLLLSIFILSCANKSKQLVKYNYDSFIFSQSQMHLDYSIKFTHSDTIYIEKRFPRPKELFYATINKSKLNRLDSFLKVIDFSNFDTTYIQNNLADGVSYKFNLTNVTTKKWIFVYGMEGPKALYQFANWLASLKERQRLNPIDSAIDFGDLKYILLPQVPAPPKE